MDDLLQRIKDLESEVISLAKKEGGSGLTKGTSADVNTGTEDTKYITAKAIKDSDVAYLSDIQSGTPTATILPFAGTTAPTGFLLCNGASLLRADYSALFTIIGTTYGTVDGTHFTLPNMAGRVPVGKSADTEFDALGETGGAKTHTLALTEIPSHRHYLQTLQDDYNVSGGSGPSYGKDNGSWITWYTDYQGGGLAHNNLQPYITLNYIIKT